MSFILEVMLPLYFMIALGYLLARLHPQLTTRSITETIIYIFIPALLLRSLLNNPIQLDEIALTVLSAFIIMLFNFAIALILSNWLKLEKASKNSFIMTSFLGNTGFLGLPVIGFLYGDKGIEIATFYILANTILAYTLGIFLAAQGKYDWQQSIKQVIKLPLVYTIIIGVGLNLSGIKLPATILKTLSTIGGATIPLSLVLLGMELTHIHTCYKWRVVSWSSALKLLLAPLIALLVVFIFKIEGLVAGVIIIESAMPSAVNTVILTSKFDCEPIQTASSVLISTVISVFTLGLWVKIILG